VIFHIINGEFVETKRPDTKDIESNEPGLILKNTS
jgi:hypothetical protein